MFYIPWERELLTQEFLLIKPNPNLELPIEIQLLREKEQLKQGIRELSNKPLISS